ncbi:lysine-specific demethylase JMJ26-like [Bidens hawaiensis]|uniref:lysine-specific demethylase JMJ26-like n=1 Tax=Bidens hawaiensis TaxID=980011 RepID=UPI00404AEAB7
MERIDSMAYDIAKLQWLVCWMVGREVARQRGEEYSLPPHHFDDGPSHSGAGHDHSDVSNGFHEQKSWCHQCRSRVDRDRVLDCILCRSKKYCVACITKWYPHVSVEEFVKACPVCCNNCNCKACLRGFSPKDTQAYSCSEYNKINYSKQILHKVFPLVKTLNEDQMIEEDIEAKLKGASVSELELELQDADVFCDRCGSYFFNLYRSCACGYVLCLVCCQELRAGQVNSGGWKARINGSIPCPPKDIGGCNDGTLDLKRVMCVDWVVNILKKAQRVYNVNNAYDNPQTCMECNASRLYSLSAKDILPQHMQHFQLHWSKGEPIIVNDVVSPFSGLSWEPMVLWRAFRDLKKSGKHSVDHEVKAINCLDWSEVTISFGKFCKGYSEGQVKMKLEDWQPPCLLYQGELPCHFIELINRLPFQDYHNGYLNVAVNLPELSSKPDMGPKMDIAYDDSVTKLHYEKSDTVNVLTHTKIVKQKHGDEHEALVCEAGPQRNEGGAEWDIFKRQDVPKLEEYIRNHSAEFKRTDRLPVEQIFHPIHDQTFYLNIEHKRKLKEEFGIEPWTFKQKLGDVVFIPAGCPYQVKNLKSSTKVELNFTSPESLGECIRLQKELCILPENHRAKQQKLNIGKMLIYALDHAVAELSGSMDLDSPTNDLHDQSTVAESSRFMDSNGPTDDLNDQSTVAEASRFMDSNGPTDDLNDQSTVAESSGFMDSNGPTDVLHDQSIQVEAGISTGMWRGNAVGQAAKEILMAVEHSYPDTFQGLQILPKPYWLSNLKELHDFIKRFIELSVHALTEDQLASLETDLKFFEDFGFNLSWVRDRLNMVKKLKFGNDPLRQELLILEESLNLLRMELIEANARFEKVTKARDKKALEVAHKFGAEYDAVLNGNLGFGLLLEYHEDFKYL